MYILQNLNKDLKILLKIVQTDNQDNKKWQLSVK